MSTSVCSCEASARPGANGTLMLTPASAAAFSTAAAPPSTIVSASETGLPNARRTSSSLATTSAVPALTGQLAWGSSRSRAPFAPPRLSVLRNVAAEDQAVCTSCATVRPDARICFFSSAASASDSSSWSTAGIGSCQSWTSCGTHGPT